jgi:hypothetical protein
VTRRNLEDEQCNLDPLNPSECRLDKGAFAVCGEVFPTCCFSAQDAIGQCKRKYGPDYGWSNVTARQATAETLSKDQKLPDCARGLAYQCYANIDLPCDSAVKQTVPYNKNGPFGSNLILNDSVCYEHGGDADCRWWYTGDKNAKINAQCIFGVPTSKTGQVCAISDWKGQFGGNAQPLEDCCNPANTSATRSLYCDPQTCFGRPDCDRASVTQQVCSDKDNIATDPACKDTCMRLNETNSRTWCNDAIQKYCEKGNNIESEECRDYCTAKNLDENKDLAEFCENAYGLYCKSEDYVRYNRARQSQLCGCIGSPIPEAVCVGADCTNSIGPTTRAQRDILRAGCPDTICLQNFIVDGKAVINIDNSSWNQYCPGYAIPGSKATNPQNVSLYVIVPVIVILLIAALVLLFRP